MLKETSLALAGKRQEVLLQKSCEGKTAGLGSVTIKVFMTNANSVEVFVKINNQIFHTGANLGDWWGSARGGRRRGRTGETEASGPAAAWCVEK